MTNFGLNTKYHASAEKPALLYYGDFQGDGIHTLVEAEFEQEHLYPVRGKSCSTAAMPFLAEKFKTYKDFAIAELDDIYTQECLEDSHRFAATTLESGVYFNQGNNEEVAFRFEPLPRLAQVAPCFGAVVADANFDGYEDIIIAQNFFSPQPETGRMDGGLSILLLGDGTGQLKTVWPRRSGIIEPGDSKSLAMTDFNLDGRLDPVFGVNNADASVYLNEVAGGGAPMLVRLAGRSGNPSCFGARVTVVLDDGSAHVREIYGGSGYLSQSTAAASFSIPPRLTVVEVVVNWPTGETTRHEARPVRLLTIDQDR